jgi:3-phenylpropionate/trans-cinnamate dioxygenase ferredoxin subunit
MGTWRAACGVDDVDVEDLVAVTIDGRSIAIYHSPDDEWFATDGMCTHEETPLADGLVMDYEIECPKHNGRFDYRTGKGKGAPICVDLRTYPARVEGDTVYVDLG